MPWFGWGLAECLTRSASLAYFSALSLLSLFLFLCSFSALCSALMSLPPAVCSAKTRLVSSVVSLAAVLASIVPCRTVLIAMAEDRALCPDCRGRASWLWCRLRRLHGLPLPPHVAAANDAPLRSPDFLTLLSLRRPVLLHPAVPGNGVRPLL